MSSNRATPLSRLIGLSVAVAATSLAGQSALAQEVVADVLEEVIVTTARQRAENLQDVPASITAFSASTLEAAGVDRAGDFIRLTPGVSLVQAAEVGDAQVNIRGINGARDAENSFALIIDGVLQTNPAAFNREYSDLKQIEIVKGPQGAIYGRSAAAGAIIITTTLPRDSFGGDFKVGYGEDNTQTAQAVISGPLTDRSGWKIAADYRKTDGFFRNSFLNQKNVDDYEGFNVNARLIFEPSDSSTLDVKAHYGKVDAASISFNASFALPAVAVAFGAPAFDEDPNDHPFAFINNVDPQNDQEVKDISVKFDSDLAFGRLTAWALYSDIQNSLSADGTSGAFGFFFNDPQCLSSAAATFNSMFPWPAPQFQAVPDPRVPGATVFGAYTPVACDGTQYQERNQKDYSFELRLASNNDGRLDWLTGLYYLNIDRTVGINTGIDNNNGRVTPQLFVPRGQPNGTEALLWDNFTSDVYAVFGSLNYDVSDTLEAGLALRYDREERSVTNLVPVNARTQYIDTNPADGFTGNAALNPGLFPGIGNPAGIPDKSETFSQIQPKVTLTWEPSEDWTWFANWGIGFKSGGFNNSGSAATVDTYINSITGAGEPGGRSVIIRDVFDKEKSSAAEAGFKARLMGNRLSFEGAIYHTSVDDMQFFEFLVGAFGLLRVVSNIDKVELDGLELAANFRVTDEFRLSAGYSRIQSEIKANTSRPKTVGNKSPYTPDYTATLGAEFDVPVGDVWSLQAGAFYNLTGPTWFHTIQDNTNLTLFAASFGPVLGRADYSKLQRNKYSTVDMRLALVSDTLSVALVGKNVTDETFLQEVIPAPEFGGAFIHPSGERRFSVEVGYKF